MNALLNSPTENTCRWYESVQKVRVSCRNFYSWCLLWALLLWCQFPVIKLPYWIQTKWFRANYSWGSLQPQSFTIFKAALSYWKCQKSIVWPLWIAETGSDNWCGKTVALVDTTLLWLLIGGIKSWWLCNCNAFARIPKTTNLTSDLCVEGYLLSGPRGPRAARGHCRLCPAVQLLNIDFHHLTIGPL